MQIRGTRNLPIRKLLGWLGLAIALLVLNHRVTQTDTRSPFYVAPDFAMYWISGRLHLSGENPYDPEILLPLERERFAEQPEAYIMYSPPWALDVVLPFSLMGYQAGRVAWFLFNGAVILVAMGILWRYYGGPVRYRWLAWLIAFGFFPTLLLLKYGQMGSLLLLGIVAFLHFESRGRDELAGAALALLALKPQLLYLFWIALFLWIIRERRGRVALGATLAGLVAALIPLCINPAVFRQYWCAVTMHRPTAWITPTLGTALRLAFGRQQEWLQFVPLALGIAWLLAYWWRHRKTWEWAQQVAPLLFVSLLTTCYASSQDFVLLLVPMLQVACATARDSRPLRARVAIAVYLAVDLVAVAHVVAGYGGQVYLCWMPPALLLAYLGLTRSQRVARVLRNVGSGNSACCAP